MPLLLCARQTRSRGAVLAPPTSSILISARSSSVYACEDTSSRKTESSAAPLSALGGLRAGPPANDPTRVPAGTEREARDRRVKFA